MPDWTSIPNSALAVGAPPRAADAVALRDNPIAMARGAPGAPTVSPWALGRRTVGHGTERFYDSGPIAAFLTDVSNFGSQQFSGTWPMDVSSYAHAVTILNNGTVRVGWTQGRAAGVGTGGPEARIGRVRNGTFAWLSTATTNSNSGAQEGKTYNATILEGDTIVWGFRTTNGGNTMQIYSFWLGTSGAELMVLPPFFRMTTAPV